MDTRFWGPSAWRLIHLIAFSDHRTQEVYTFLEELPHILPCRFCRSSLAEYYIHRPVTGPKDDMARWAYEIHNDVNNKLRQQGYLRKPNPPFSEVKEYYEKLLLESKHVLGFDFFKSVAFVTSKLDPSHLQRWWSSIPKALPFPEWREQWSAAVKKEGNAPVRKGRTAVLAWLYKICGHLEAPRNATNFKDYCREARAFSSSCPKGKGTCRSTKTRRRETIKKRRAITLKQIGGFF